MRGCSVPGPSRSSCDRATGSRSTRPDWWKAAMSARVLPETAALPEAAPRRRGPWRRRWGALALPAYVGIFIAYLLVPIAVMILYSFNQSNANLPTVTFKPQGFTTQWWRTWNQVPGLTPAFYLSLRLALATALVAAVLGTLLALALVRYRFGG